MNTTRPQFGIIAVKGVLDSTAPQGVNPAFTDFLETELGARTPHHIARYSDQIHLHAYPPHPKSSEESIAQDLSQAGFNVDIIA